LLRHPNRSSFTPFSPKNPEHKWRNKLKEWWQNKAREWIRNNIGIVLAPPSYADKCLYSLIGVNIVVWTLWRLPALRPLMNRYFLNSFAAKSLCWPMLLSTFSHYSIIHLALNMYVLRQCGGVAVDTLGVNQFLAFYIASGLFSSFASITQKAIIRSPVAALGAVSDRIYI
jgi:membrane associated rhomboid family serine protease